MLRTLSILALINAPALCVAQTLYNNGATLQLNSGGHLQVNGSLTNNTGTINNNGTVVLTGNFTNNSNTSAAAASTLRIEGSSAQTFNGTTTINAGNVVMNNPAGLTLLRPLQVDGGFTFSSGYITGSGANHIIFTANASVVGTPTNASHLVGFARKLGTGSFIYPVGRGGKYQPIAVNLSVNSGFLQAGYINSDAGTGTFSTAGTEQTPLSAYNTGEFWSFTHGGSISGTVTVFWDGSRDDFPYQVAQRRIARKAGNGTPWLNMGGVGTGTTTAGSVTSGTTSSWGGFIALGSTGYALPVHWLSISGSLTAQKQASLKWSVEEQSVVRYEVEMSTNGSSFTSIAIIAGKGNGTHSYSLTESTTLSGTSYYRIRQVDEDGRYSYSSIIKLSADKNAAISLYPNPVKGKTIVSIPKNLLGTKATLSSIEGKKLQVVKLQEATSTVDMSSQNPGVYLLQFADGKVEKIIKQ